MFYDNGFWWRTYTNNNGVLITGYFKLELERNGIDDKV